MEWISLMSFYLSAVLWTNALLSLFVTALSTLNIASIFRFFI